MRMLNFSFRAKVLLIYSACALALVFAVFVAGSYYINRLQKSNVQAALELAREQARRMSKEILELATQQNSSDLSEPTIKAGIKAMTQVTVRMNRHVVWAAVVDAKGNRTTQWSDTPGTLQTQLFDNAAKTVNRLPGPTGAELQIETEPLESGLLEVKEPIRQEGKEIGRIELRLKQSAEFQQIEDSSKNITEALVTGCVFMLIFLLLIFAVLYRLFSRQVHLVEKNARLDRMAYVGTLASGLAHEIRNPLSAMSINLEVMREELAEPEGNGDTPERARELATRVQREVHQLNSTLTSFLDFALPSKEGISEFSVRGLMDEILELHAEEMRQAGIAWEVAGPSDESVLVEGDRRLLLQAFRNIVVNAIQVLQNSVKKQMKIRVDPTQNQRVRVVISDTGPGISQENMAKIFDVFFSTRKGGSGFGLAITRKIIEEHGGAIRAENNEQSLGASFVVEVPKQVVSKNQVFSLRRRGRLLASSQAMNP